MKTLRDQLLILCLLTFSFAAVAQTASTTRGCAPVEINFTPPGNGPHFWEFGTSGNPTSTLGSPSNIYSEPGTFTVTYRSSQGGPVVGTITIQIFEKPSLDFTVDPSSGCSPLTVNFTDNSTIDPGITVTGYQWVYGDGASDVTTAPNTTHIYTQTGNITPALGLNTSFPSCNVAPVIKTDLIQVSVPPSVGFVTSPNPPIACDPPLNVSFTNVSPNAGDLTFSWDYGNGNTSTGPAGVDQTYGALGDYTVVLTATDNTGCTNTFSQTITVGSPTANFTTADTSNCFGDLVEFVNLSSAGTYQWDFGSNAVPQTSTEFNPIVEFSAPGTYNVSLSVTSAAGGCVGDTIIQVVIDQANATFSAQPLVNCNAPFDVDFIPNSNIGASYEWNFGDSTFSDQSNPTHTYMDPDPRAFAKNGFDTFFVSLTVTNPSGCSSTETNFVILNQPDAFFVPDVVDGCAPLSVTFADSSLSDSPITSWQWIYGDGTTETFTNNNPPTHVYSDPGEYEATLVITNSLGCMDTSYVVLIEVGSQLMLDFNADNTTVCPNDTVRFTDVTNTGGVEIDAWHFETDDSRSFHCPSEDNLTYLFDDETGDIDVTLHVIYNGCQSTVTKEDFITVNGPIAQIDYETYCETPFDFTFRDSSDDALIRTWYFGDGDSLIALTDTFVHTYADTGDYTVILKAENLTTGCPTSFDTAMVFVRDIKAEIMLDTIVCLGAPQMMDATMTEGSVADCWRGYTWKFEPALNRPITTQDSIIEFTYQDTGRYTVTMIALDINGCRDTTEESVRVYNTVPRFEADKTLFCLPDTVTFTDFSVSDTTITDWMWDFGDGQMSTDQNPPPHIYAFGSVQDTIITVTLEVTDAAGCGSTFSLDLNLYRPESQIITDPVFPNICVGDDVIFTATDFTEFGSNLRWNWDFGNGQSGTQQTETITYDMAGDFPVTLTFEEIATGCPGQTLAFVNVQDFPIANYSSALDTATILCAGTYEFTDQSTPSTGLTYLWNFGNGQFGNGMTATASFDRGTFDVTEIVSTTNGCTDDTTRTFTFVGPEAEIMVDRDVICDGESVTFELINQVDVGSFTWNFGDGGSGTTNPVTHTYSAPAPGVTIFDVIAIIEDNSGICDNNLFQQITVVDPVANFTLPTGCADVQTNFINTSEGANQYTWDFGDGTPVSTEESPSHIYTAEGQFTVTLIASNTAGGCADTISSPINIGDIEDPIFGDISICAGSIDTFSLPSDYDTNRVFDWSGNGNFFTAINGGLSVILNTSTMDGDQLTLLISDSMLICSTELVVPINVVPILEFDSVGITVCTGPNEVQLPHSVDADYTYTITPQGSAIPPDNVDLNNLSFSINIPESEEDIELIYEIKAEDRFGLGCSFPVAIDTIRVGDSALKEFPNTFTPDGNDQNDYFNFIIDPGREDEVDVQRFQVFNRWGNLVYDNENPQTGWSGHVNDELAPSDTYLYIFEAQVAGCPTKVVKGDISLLR